MADLSINALSKAPEITTNNALKEIQNTHELSNTIFNIDVKNTRNLEKKILQRHLETMIINTDRALANETSTQALKSIFSKFSLIQKIMQNMN